MRLELNPRAVLEPVLEALEFTAPRHHAKRAAELRRVQKLSTKVVKESKKRTPPLLSRQSTRLVDLQKALEEKMYAKLKLRIVGCKKLANSGQGNLPDAFVKV